MDANQFQPCGLSAENLYLSLAYTESFRQQRYQFAIGLAVDGGRLQPHLQRFALPAVDTALWRARHDLNAERGGGLCCPTVWLGSSYILTSTPKTSCSTMLIRISATMGVISIIPIGGMIRRSGSITGSVNW